MDDGFGAIIAIVLALLSGVLIWSVARPSLPPLRDLARLSGKALVAVAVALIIARFLIVPALVWIASRDALLGRWGAGEWIGFFGIAIGVGGLYYALRSIRSAERASRDAQDAADRLLRHEQSAELMIPQRPGDYADEIPEGASLWLADDSPKNGVAIVRGRLRNVGRHGARDVSLRVFQGDEPLAVWNGPPSYIEADSHAFLFEFELPLGPVDTTGDLRAVEAVFPEDRSILIMADYADGNQARPEEFMGRIWEFTFRGDRPWDNWAAEELDFGERFRRPPTRPS